MKFDAGHFILFVQSPMFIVTLNSKYIRSWLEIDWRLIKHENQYWRLLTGALIPVSKSDALACIVWSLIYHYYLINLSVLELSVILFGSFALSSMIKRNITMDAHQNSSNYEAFFSALIAYTTIITMRQGQSILFYIFCISMVANIFVRNLDKILFKFGTNDKYSVEKRVNFLIMARFFAMIQIEPLASTMYMFGYGFALAMINYSHAADIMLTGFATATLVFLLPFRTTRMPYYD